jgi:hypothetical protein
MNNVVSKQFEPCYFGNGWGNYADIENYEYNLLNLQRITFQKDNKYSQNYYDNSKNNEEKVATSLIIKVSSTTLVTFLLSYFVYRNI